MSCPTTVPTYGFDTCFKPIIFTNDGDATLPAHADCYGEQRVKTATDKGTLDIYIDDAMVLQQSREFFSTHSIFAVKIEHLGRIAWHIVRQSGTPVTFKPNGNTWSGAMKVDVLGYTYTGTPMTMPEVLVDSGGVELVDAYGNTLYSEMVAGEATGCITL